jgi:phage terminase large subunit-like protein
MSKEARVRSVSTLIQNGFIRFAEKGNEDIIKELTEFPKGAFDDLCDALVHAVNVISKGDKPTVVSKIPTKIRTTAKSIIARTRGC